MFFERPDELIATRQSPERALSPHSMRKPVLEAVIIGKARHHAGIAEAECRHRCVLRQIDCEMGSNAGRTSIADEDDAAALLARTQPGRAGVGNPGENPVVNCRRVMEAPHIIVEESLVIGIDVLHRHRLAARRRHDALIPAITSICKGILPSKLTAADLVSTLHSTLAGLFRWAFASRMFL